MSTNPPRVLIVDDQLVICAALRRALQARCEVDIATGGVEAISRLRSDEDYALVLCDLSMPDANGLDVLEVVERERPRLLGRVVVMTGKIYSGEEQRRLVELGVNVLHKPFGSTDLLSVVMGYIAGANARPATVD
jgi:CheY-like chemotaxis protein